MTQAQVNALLQALEQQRNAAFNALAETNANLALANQQIQALQEHIATLTPEVKKKAA